MKLFDISDRTTTNAPPQAVRVNGTEISQAAIAQEIQNHPAETPGAARVEAVRALVVRELLLQQTARLGLEAEPIIDADGTRETDEEALVRLLLEAEVDMPTPTQDECRRFYETNAARFCSTDIYEAAHILFPATRDDPEAYAAARGAAEQAISVLSDHPGRFTEMAEALSGCTSGKAGGNLGQITAGQTTPAFEEALVALEPGTITTEPVCTRYGVHVIRLDRKIDGATLPFDLVEAQIADYLADAVFHRAVHQYIAILAGQATVEGFEMTASPSPLVQ